MSGSQKHKQTNAKLNNARRHLRKLEIEAYASAVDVFRAQGVLTKEKLTALESFGKLLEIPIERHYAELRRALSDGELNKTAETLIGFDPSSSWFEEAEKFADFSQPFIPKARFTTNAFRAISNYYTNQMLRDLLPCEETNSTEETVKNGVDSDSTEHDYHTKLNPLTARIMREGGCEYEEHSVLSRTYLTPVGLEELTDVFTDPGFDYGDLDNPPLSPAEGAHMDNYFLTTGIRRGMEPKTLPTKRRRCTSEHKSQTTEDASSYETRRASEKNTPSSMSKVMQDYQMIMNLTKKKQKVDPADPPTDRRRGKGKKLDSVTQESPGLAVESKNRSGLIVPCISIERMPLSQSKASTPSPGKQSKSATATTSETGSIKKPHIKRMKKKQLSQNTETPTPPGKQRRRVRVKQTLVSPLSTDNTEMKSSDTSIPPSTAEDIVANLTPTPDITSMQISEETAVLSTTGLDTASSHQQLPLLETDNKEYIEPHIPTTSLTMDDNIQDDVMVDAPGAPVPGPGDVPDQLVTGLMLSEQLPVRRKKGSNTSLDIPSPDKIRSEIQSLYSPISSLDTPPDLDRAAHFELVPPAEVGISRPIFSPITSPEDSQSPGKDPQKLATLSTERLSLVLQEPCMDILPQKCSLALSDIVDEVCESLSDPLSPSLLYTSRDDAKPSPDSVFTDSSLMLSKALNSFITQVISEESVSTDSHTSTQLDELIDTQVLPPGENLEFAQLSASLLSIEQPTDSTENTSVPTNYAVPPYPPKSDL